MLILTRKPGERLTIGENIRVTILEVRGKQVRLGIEAPAEVVVLREEIWQRLAQENLQATKFQYSDLNKIAQALGGELPASWGLKESAAAGAAVTLDTSNWGRVTVPQDGIITFPGGLPGLGKSQNFVFLEEPRSIPFGFLQCVNDPRLCLVVAEPLRVNPDFVLGPMTSALKSLEALSVQELKILAILTIPTERPQETTANLQCPLLINPTLRQGKQVILENSQYSPRYQVLAGAGVD